jgi:penicillin amidase
LSGLSSNDRQVQAALERLRGWDLQMQRDSVPAALFAIFYMNLARNVLADEVGAENVAPIANNIFFHSLASQPGAIWWNNVNTETAETQPDILLQALGDTVAWFEENVGGDMNDWTWGRLHTATFVSNPLGQSGVGLVESIVNRGPFPAAGSSSTVNATRWSWDDPAAITSHPSMRMIIDMSNFDASQGVLPTGQSGHPYHRHYDDMIQLWLNGRYHTMLFGEEAVQAAAAEHLILEPGG